jgi:hypothetical protein
VVLDARSAEKFAQLHVKGRAEPEFPGHHGSRTRQGDSVQVHASPDLLQQQFPQ